MTSAGRRSPTARPLIDFAGWWRPRAATRAPSTIPTRLPAARRSVVLKSPASGFVSALAARPIGHATMLLGAGRARMDSSIDHAVGVILHKKVGNAVRLGEPLCTFYVNDESRLAEASALILDAYTIAASPDRPPPLLVERIAASPARRARPRHLV